MEATSAELGRRCRGLHDAASRLIETIAHVATNPAPVGRARDPQYLQCCKDLYDSTVYRHLLAEVAAFRALMRQADPAAGFPTDTPTYKKEVLDNQGCSDFPDQDNPPAPSPAQPA
jgi:hypothetical protein